MAPGIVDAIDAKEDFKSIYQKIYDSVIKVCVDAFEKKEYDKAYSIYSDMVLNLENEYMGLN